MTSLNESVVEEAALDWLVELGYTRVHGPEIGPGEPASERADYGAAVLEGRLRDALARLNPHLPAEALNNAIRQASLVDGPSIVTRNQAFHRMFKAPGQARGSRQRGSLWQRVSPQSPDGNGLGFTLRHALQRPVEDKQFGVAPRIAAGRRMGHPGSEEEPVLTAADHRWHSVLTRDPRADGAFVYAVTSTRIYCRPICPSRRPARARVRLYPHAAAAERDGFRPCRRCRPADPSPGAALTAVRRACRLLATSPGRRIDGASLARAAGLSPRALQRAFRRYVGLSPSAYARACHLCRFKASVSNGASVTEALYYVGYGSPSRLYESADALLGMSPRAYADGGRGTEVRYASGPSPAGTLLLAASERGICALSLGDDEAALVAELRREFPTAVLREEPDALRPWVQLAAQHVAGATPWLEIPLDIRASAFQRRVWEVLRRIPPGETISYGALAQAIGVPKAARAVGRACATNPVSLAVPCHRAVGSEGAPRGYRWGVDRKRALLGLERAHSADGAADA